MSERRLSEHNMNVVVHTEDEQEASSVEKVLIEKDPLEVQRFDRGGRRLKAT